MVDTPAADTRAMAIRAADTRRAVDIQAVVRPVADTQAAAGPAVDIQVVVGLAAAILAVVGRAVGFLAVVALAVPVTRVSPRAAAPAVGAVAWAAAKTLVWQRRFQRAPASRKGTPHDAELNP